MRLDSCVIRSSTLLPETQSSQSEHINRAVFPAINIFFPRDATPGPEILGKKTLRLLFVQFEKHGIFFFS